MPLRCLKPFRYPPAPHWNSADFPPKLHFQMDRLFCDWDINQEVIGSSPKPDRSILIFFWKGEEVLQKPMLCGLFRNKSGFVYETKLKPNLNVLFTILSLRHVLSPLGNIPNSM